MSKQRAATPSSPLADVDQPLRPAAEGRSQQEAAELRWTYYKANKGELISDISLYRDAILESLMRGASPEEAFAPYRRPVTSALRTAVNKPLRANAQAQQT